VKFFGHLFLAIAVILIGLIIYSILVGQSRVIT
jgi:hypothetical protein